MGVQGVKHYPTDKNRAEVAALTSFGITQEEIAKFLDISVETLVRYYKQELDTALIRANAAVANKLYKKAVEQEDLTAIMFWLKTRAKWRERDKEEKKDEAASLLERIITGEVKLKP